MKRTIPFSTTLVTMSWRNIWRQKKRSYLVMSTAVVGMLGVVFMMGWINGLFDAMISGGIDTGLGHVQIRPEGYNVKKEIGSLLPDASAIMKAVGSAEAASSEKFYYSPRLERQGLLRLGSFTRGVMLMGIDPETEPGVSSFHRWMVSGEYLTSDENQNEFMIPVLLGQSTAEKLEIEVGDSVVLSTGDSDGENVSLRGVIQGLFQTPIEPINKYTVIVRRSDLSHLYDATDNHMSTIVIHGKKREEADILKTLIAGEVKKNVPSSSAEVLTYTDLQKELKKMLDLSSQFQGIFYVILLTGFALTLLNSVLMSVFERMREIGIQRALGAKVWVIIVGILLESLFIALIGSSSGIVLGGAIVVLTGWTGISFGAFLEGIELMGNVTSIVYPYLTVSDIVLAFTISILMSLLAGLYPAWKASRTDPVVAMQNK